MPTKVDYSNDERALREELMLGSKERHDGYSVAERDGNEVARPLDSSGERNAKSLSLGCESSPLVCYHGA